MSAPVLYENLRKYSLLNGKILIFLTISCKMKVIYNPRMEVKVWTGYVENMILAKGKQS